MPGAEAASKMWTGTSRKLMGWACSRVPPAVSQQKQSLPCAEPSRWVAPCLALRVQGVRLHLKLAQGSGVRG